MLKSSVRKLLATCGYRLDKLTAGNDHGTQLARCLKHFAIDSVLDVGANQGQFARDLRAAGYKGRIVSFEPLSGAHALLSARAERDAAWVIHPRSAVGDTNGTISINVSGNSVSSSVLPMLDAHAHAARDSVYVGSEQVPIVTLDSVTAQYLRDGERVFLKIDTQGFEWQVLDGARETLRRARGVHCEMSMVPLYEGQRLWKDVLERLEDGGFRFWSLQQGFTDERDGRTLQFDATFFRDEKH